MLSIVVPVFNEEAALTELCQQINHTCDVGNIASEVILVDDGSTDGSWKVIRNLAEQQAHVSGIRLRRNFGKAAALTAGMRAAKSTHILMMDADLQDDPAEIPRFLEKLAEGFDVVNGWKQNRRDPWHKVYPSRVFNWLVGRLTGLRLHDHNCGMKLFRSEVAGEIRIYGELHRFIPVLAHARGFQVTEIPVNHRKRPYGVSKYGLRRFLRGFLDLLTVKFLTGFGQRPQHMLGAVGLGFLTIGLIGLSYLSIYWLVVKMFTDADPAIGQRPLLAYSVAATLLGGQAISLGLMAELIVAYTGRESDTFSIAEQVGSTEEAENDN